MPADPRPVRLMHCDLNWTVDGAAAAHDWAHIDPQEYFDWHVEFGSNVIYCQAYTFGGFAFYDTRLGPVAPGPGRELFPRLYELARAADLPVWSYFCVGADLTLSNQRNHWVVPGSRDEAAHGFLAPETEWTELLVARVEEFLGQFPVDWLLFDWFVYGGLRPNETRLSPAPFMVDPFRQICGRPLPRHAGEITDAEALAYKREVLAVQFRRLRDAVRATSPGTKILFNVPYWEPAEALWVDHPMLRESDGLFAECSRPEVMEWLLAVRRDDQRVMTTIVGRQQEGECDPSSWRRWYEAGCDFFGYAWGRPPDFRPHPRYDHDLATIRAAFEEMERGNAGG
jgi:hypothetical protein